MNVAHRRVVMRLQLTIWVLCMGLLGFSFRSNAQSQGEGIVMLAEVIDGDTVPVKYLRDVLVVGEHTFRSKSAKKKWNRTKYNVKKVYPYAKLAGDLLEKYQVPLDTITDPRERKKYFKLIEKELMAEFDDDIRSMTTTQGRILIKLIDRETTHTSYEIVQEFRGNFTAFFWQGMSRLFGHDLKSTYDPYGEDQEIESIVRLIEAGMI